MADLYVRIDDRLIHGQTIVAWCPALGIKEIVAIDDVSAKNPMLKNIMSMGVPSVYRTHIVSIEEAREGLSRPGNGNRLVIIKRPDRLLDIEDEIRDTKAIILGNLAKQADAVHKLDGATGIFYLSDSDVETLNHFADKGIQVFFHQLPTSLKTTWEAFKKTI